jgi:hypothetical protein
MLAANRVPTAATRIATIAARIVATSILPAGRVTRAVTMTMMMSADNPNTVE